MTVPDLACSSTPAIESDAEVVLLAARPAEDGVEVLAPAGYEWVAPLLATLGASGAADELTRIPARGDGPAVVAIAGLGDRSDAAGLRLAAGSALRQLAAVGSVAVAIPVGDATSAAALLEGAALGAYAFGRYRTEPKATVGRVTLHTEVEDVPVGRVRSVVAAVARTKDLVNTPPLDLFPERFAEIAVEAADAAGVSSRVWDEAALAADDFGGILAIGLGSSRGPRLVRLEYAPAGASVHLALVGKGITFDSGGLSLKPMASLVGMKMDMAGAAAVLSAIIALAELEVPIRVTGWLCLAENMPSGTAVRPNDVLRMHGGTTVEVLNTDAEGRLVMADGLVAASREQPDAIVDVATLTGAQVSALGHRISGLMGDDALVAQTRSAADAVDEAVWPMPLPRDLRSLLKSDVADLTNTKLGVTVPGMLLAGVFLREFIGSKADSDDRIPWAHLDIAGPAYNAGGAWGFTGSGGTGVTVRTLIRLSEDLAAG